MKKGKKKKKREGEEENFRKYTGRCFSHLEAEKDNLDFKLQMLFIVCCVKCFNETIFHAPFTLQLQSDLLILLLLSILHTATYVCISKP